MNLHGPGCTHPEDCCKGPGVCTHGCSPRLVDGPGCTPVRLYVIEDQEQEHHGDCDVHVYGPDAICACEALRFRDQLAARGGTDR